MLNSNYKKIKKNLRNNYLSLGGWLQIPNISSTLLMSNGPFDWICIDFEHGNFNFSDLIPIINQIKINNKLSVIRLGKNQRVLLEQCLEYGIDGIIFSKIEKAEELSALIKRANYPPIGDRGVGHSISNHYGSKLETMIKTFQPFICAMIESKEGVKNLNEITLCKNLDSIFIGPYDLSSSLGYKGNLNNRNYLSCVNRILDISKENNITCGIHIIEGDNRDIKRIFKKGFNFIAYKTDALMFSESINNIKI